MSVIYRSYTALGDDIRRWCMNIKTPISAVSGVPRSGLLCAAMMAEELHVPYLPIEHLMGRCPSPYRPPVSRRLHEIDGPVLVLDDSGWTGKTMQKVKSEITNKNVIYGAVYASKEVMDKKILDIRGYHLPDIWHSFAWNSLRDHISRFALLDCDGVVAQDWGKPDDGPEWLPKYLDFLDNAKPLRKPTRPPLAIVTARLEKYRPQTERWLRKHQIPYKQLIMAPYDSPKERQAKDGFAGRKSEIYLQMAKDKGAKLFVESDRRQAEEIARRTKLPVLCFEDHTLFNGREPEPAWD